MTKFVSGKRLQKPWPTPDLMKSVNINILNFNVQIWFDI